MSYFNYINQIFCFKIYFTTFHAKFEFVSLPAKGHPTFHAERVLLSSCLRAHDFPRAHEANSLPKGVRLKFVNMWNEFYFISSLIKKHITFPSGRFCFSWKVKYPLTEEEVKWNLLRMESPISLIGLFRISLPA